MTSVPQNIWQALSLAWELGFMIALPIVAFGMFGKYLDGRWGTAPGLTLGGILLAMVTSSVWIYRHLKPFVVASRKPEAKNQKL